MGVAVTVVPRQKALERSEQVPFGPRTCLHDGQPGRGVRHEDVDQAVTLAGAEPGQLVGQVDDAEDRGVDVDLKGSQSSILPPGERSRRSPDDSAPGHLVPLSAAYA